MTHKESENLSFRVSQLKVLIKGSMRMLDLANLEFKKRLGWVEIKMDKIMGHIDKNMERIANLIQNMEGKIPKGDDVGQGSQ